MVYRCPGCLQLDTRPGVRFQPETFCGPCQFHKKLSQTRQDEVDFLNLLKELDPTESFKIPRSTLLGVSGGKDSLKQAIWLRDKCGIEPLLVCLSSPAQQITRVGLANLANLAVHGFSIVSIHLPSSTWKDFMRQGFRKFGNYMKSTELALISSVPRYALENDHQIIFWGENPGVLNDDRGVLLSDDWNGNNLRNLNTLQGGEAEWIDLSESSIDKVEHYRFPSKEDFLKRSLQIIFMSSFMPEWSLVENGRFSGLNGLEFHERTTRDTGDIYGISSLDDKWVSVNQMMKFYKFGFGKASEYLTQEVRAGKLEKTMALRIIDDFDGLCADSLIKEFCEFIEIEISEFWQVVESFTDKSLFTIQSGMRPRKRFK